MFCRKEVFSSHICKSSVCSTLGILERSPWLRVSFQHEDSLALVKFLACGLVTCSHLMAIALAQSPISTRMVSVSTSQDFHCGVLVPEAPEEDSRHL